MPGFNMPESLQLRLSERRKKGIDGREIMGLSSCVSPRKQPSKKSKKQKQKQKRNLLPAFNSVDEWVVIALHDNKENELTEEVKQASFITFTKQERAHHNRQLILGQRITRAKEMATLRKTPNVSPDGQLGKQQQQQDTTSFSAASSPPVLQQLKIHIDEKLSNAASKKGALLWEKINRARQLARLRTPRKRRPSLTFVEQLSFIQNKQLAAQSRRQQILARRVKRAVELGDRQVVSTLRERRQFQMDELNAKLAAASERRMSLLSQKRKRAVDMGHRGIPDTLPLSLQQKSQMLSDLLSFKLEAAKERREVEHHRKVMRAVNMGEGSVLMRMNRKRLFMGDVLTAKLDAAEERRKACLMQRKRVARSLGDGNSLWQAMQLEHEELSMAMGNLWHLKLEAASARRNIQLIQRKRRAYELGDEIVRASLEVRQTLRAFGHASKQRAAELRRSGIQKMRVQRARQLGCDQNMSERRQRLKQQKVDRLKRKLEQAAAKRRLHLKSKSKRAEELGTERVEKRQKTTTMHNCIQEAARIGRIKQAETRRIQNLVTLQTKAARNNARAAAIPSLVEQRQEQEKRMAERFIAFKMARAEMNRDVMKLLRCGMHGDPTFSLVKPIAFIV